MEELLVEISQEFAVVSVAIWILVAALYKLPIPESKFPKELMAIIIGIITSVAGYFMGLFTGNIIVVIATAIVAVFISQTAYDKVKATINKIKK